MPFHCLFALIFVLSLGSSAIAQDDELLDRSKNSLNIHLSGEITPTAGHPYAGFWKENCSKESGLAIAHAGRGLYSVSFCGPGGCFKPGAYRPNTPWSETSCTKSRATIECSSSAWTASYPIKGAGRHNDVSAGPLHQPKSQHRSVVGYRSCCKLLIRGSLAEEVVLVAVLRAVEIAH
jgi:hypothetical protein